MTRWRRWAWASASAWAILPLVACAGRSDGDSHRSATVVSGLLPQPPAESVRDAELHLLCIPFASTPGLRDNALDRIGTLVERRSGLRLRVTHYDDYETTREALETGVGDAALLSPLLYVQVAEDYAARPSLRGARLRLLASAVAGGSPTYVGYVAAAADGPIRELADVEGRPFGMVEGSTSGFLYPIDLADSRGLDPARLFGRVTFYPRHPEMVADLLRPAAERPIEAAALYQHIVDALAPADRARLRIVAKTGRIPRDALVVAVPLVDGREDPAALRRAAALQHAMLAVDDDPETARALRDGIGYDGWIEGDDRRYDAIRSVYRRFGRYRFGRGAGMGAAEASGE